MPRHRYDDDEDDDRPRRRRRRDDDEDDDDDRPRRRQQSGSGMGVMIAVLVGAGVLVLGGVGVGAYFLMKGKKPAPEVAGQPPAVVAPAVGQPVSQPKPKADTPPAPNGGAAAVGRVVPVPSVAPSPQRMVFGGGEDGYAAVMSFRTEGVGDRIDVVKTATGEGKGRVDVNSRAKEVAVSPDGKWLAVVGSAPFQGHPVGLYAVGTAQQANTFTPYPREGPNGLQVPELIWSAFVGSDKLITINEGSGFDVWSVPGLQRLAGQPPRKAFAIPRVGVDGFTHSPSNFALTPDGKTLALFNGTGFTFYDAATATETGKTEPVIREGGSANYWGAALRADGSRFACFCSVSTPKLANVLFVWDARTGKRVSAVQPKAVQSAAGFGWWGPDHILIAQGGVSTADVMDVTSGDVVGKVKFERTGKLGTVAPADKLWGIARGSALDPGGAAALLISAEAPPAIGPGTRFELGPQGLRVK